MLKIITVFLSLLVALPASALDGKALLTQLDKNLNPESYESYRKLINIEPDGKKKEFTLFTVKKGADKVASVFLAPASEKGRSTLRLGVYVQAKSEKIFSFGVTHYLRCLRQVFFHKVECLLPLV